MHRADPCRVAARFCSGCAGAPYESRLQRYADAPGRAVSRARSRAAVPAVVTAGAQVGGAPSDAVVLFAGKDLSQWTATKQPWKVENGYVEVVPNAGDLTSKEKFGDVQLHVEWAAPSQVRGTSQNRGNSGIFLQARYEVQVLDSSENPTYADGQAGAIYGQWPPLVNPARKPGEWQAYDIVFEAPRFEGGRLARPAYLTVFLNGVLLHHRKEVDGSYRSSRAGGLHAAAG